MDNNGTSRTNRGIRALDPGSFQWDSRDLPAMYREAIRFATNLEFEEGGDTTDWSDLFTAGADYIQALEPGGALPGSQKDCPPHLALFIAFLHLFSKLQQQGNHLTRDHLEFFYRRVLDQRRAPLVPDGTYVFFELKKGIASHRIPAMTALLAGKDDAKQNILYRTQRDVYLGHAEVAHIHAIQHCPEIGKSLYVFENLPELTRSPTGGEAVSAWPPFGRYDLSRKRARVGFGIRSSALRLESGHRSVVLSFEADLETIRDLPGELVDAKLWDVVYYTQGESVVKPLKGLAREGERLIFSMEFTRADPPIGVPPPGENPPGPILELRLASGYTLEQFSAWQAVRVKAVDISVAVSGLDRFIIRNDQGNLDASKAFHPFGFQPVVGSNFFVHVPEMDGKAINQAALSLHWKGRPENLKAYYEGYLGQTNSLVESEADFRVRISGRMGKSWVNVPGKESDHVLFQDEIAWSPPGSPSESDASESPENGMFRITLTGPRHAFGHLLYPSVYTRAIMAQMQQKSEPIPNPPYTPVAESMKIDYRAVDSITPLKGWAAGQGFWHLAPFGKSALGNRGRFALLPAGYQAAGYLYLGVRDLDAPCQFSLFFRILEKDIHKKPEVTWSYFSTGGWRRFPRRNILSDTTESLRKTGIVILNIPEDSAEAGGAMPNGFHWLRAETPADTAYFDSISEVRSNAVFCRLDVSQTLKGFTCNTLAPGEISGLQQKDLRIKQVSQPYPAFGGRQAESDSEFYRRVSERLGHKDRGVRGQDLELLVMQAFPDVYQIRVMPHTDAFGKPKAGEIKVIVIPEIPPIEAGSIRIPQASAARLEAIRDFLQERSTAHMRIHVKNALFEVLRIHAVIAFASEADEGYHLAKLNEDLKRYLTPWAFDPGRRLQMGTVLYRSAIIRFIERLPYVEFIAQLRIYKDGKLVRNDEIATGNNAVWVSADEHTLEIADPAGMRCQTHQGIEQMIIDINFQVD